MERRSVNKYDLLKVFAIVLVVVGHVTILYSPEKHPEIDTTWLKRFTSIIYLFHMPLFMAVSGSIYRIGFKKGKYHEFLPLMLNKSKRILIPYFIVGLLFLLPVLYILGKESWSDADIYNKILLAKDPRHLWYLLALMWIFVFQFIVDKLKLNHWIQFGLAVIISTMLYKYSIIVDFYCLNQGIYYWPYFILGILVQDIVNFLQPKRGALVSILGVIACGIGCYVSNNLAVDYILSLMLPCFIVIILNIIADILMRGMSSSKWIGIIADYSFAIYLFHISVIFIIHHYFGSYNPFLLIPAMFIFAMFVPVVIAMLIRKCRLQFVIGERNGK